jgi:hypothetical protein
MRWLLDWIGRVFYPAYYDIDYENNLGEDTRPYRIRESKDDE